MSFALSGSHRSSRLLPLESSEVLAATDRFRLHVLDDERDAKLQEHVSFYWDQQQGHQRYQRRLLREVGSTRGPVRFVGFPQVRQSQAAAKHGDASTAPTSTHRTDGGGRPSAAPNTNAAPSASTPSSATRNEKYDDGESADAASKWAPPRSLAAWNWVRLVAPYERLLCPSLLFSALLSPAIGSKTALLYGTEPPSADSRRAESSSLQAFIPAQWSSQTCRTLWGLHEAAAAASLPAQEVYVLCAGTLMYLDVVVSCGMVWTELEELWGSDLLPAQNDGFPEGRDKGSLGDAPSEDVEASSPTRVLASLQATLSQPPQTYASLLQHVRILLEAVFFIAPTAAAAAATAEARPTSSSGTASRSPQLLLPWLTAAAESEEWTAATTAPSVVAGTATTGGCASAASPSAKSTAHHTSVVAQVLKLAVREWLSRRGTTVTAAAPTGSRAVSVTARDLCIPSGGPLTKAASARPHHGTTTAAGTTRDTRRSESSKPTQEGNDARSTAPVTPTSSSTSTAAATTTTATAVAFEPFEPHDTPRAQHPFFLPPLPQDPALLVFTAVWRRTLRRCVLEKDVVRQQLRQVVLGQAGQRCEELLRAVRQQRQQQHEEKTEMEKEAVQSSDSPAKDAGGLASTDPNNLNAKEGNVTSSSTTPGKADATSPAFSAPPPLLLLTSDPAATSFRVLGPRSGEWLTSRSGAWSGFRGELFRCVGGPPPPPSPPPPLASSSASWPGVPESTAVCSRYHPPHGTSPGGEASSSSATSFLLERFVDGALELDSSTRTTVSSSSFSSSAAANVAPTPAPLTTEELADRLCRLGATLPRYATEISGDRLRPVDADFAREVLQRQCLPLFLACKRRGIQQWSLRGWLKGIALTLLDNSGTESRVATPAKLLEVSRRQLAAAMGGTDTTDTAAALRMVMEGGLSEAVAFLEYVQKRKERTLRWLPTKRVSTAATITTETSPAPFSAVEALLLRRAEESAIFSIFQCHPRAVALAGCGVQRLALHASPHTSRPSLLLLARTCGVVVEWDMQDCYEAPRHRRLRAPKRLVTEGKRKGCGAVGGTTETDDAPPPEIGTAVSRLTLRHVRGMLQYYHRALLTSSSSTSASSAVKACKETKPAASSTTLAQATPVADTTTSSAHATGVKRTREDEETKESPPAVVASTVPVAAAAASVYARGTRTVKAEEEEAEEEMKPPPIKQEVEEEGEQHGNGSGPSAPNATASSSPSLPSTTPMERTSLFPIDRAVALFVLRHHPQYYTQVVGCGIKEVYVAVRSASATDTGAAPRHVDAAAHTNSSDCEGASSLSSSPPEVRRRDSLLNTCATPTQLSTVASSSSSSLSSSDTALRPVLVVERVCGQRVEVDVEACYDRNVEGCPLRPRIILA